MDVRTRLQQNFALWRRRGHLTGQTRTPDTYKACLAPSRAPPRRVQRALQMAGTSAAPPLWASPPPPNYTPTAWALRRLYEATDGAGWTRNDGWMTGDPCDGHLQWSGPGLPVACENGQLTDLYLKENGLRGTLPTELGLLRSSGRLNINLRGNSISGTLPTEIGWLSSLATLYIFSFSAWTEAHFGGPGPPVQFMAFGFEE